MLVSEIRPSPSQAALDFINNQQGVRICSQLARSVQKFRD